MEIDTNNKELMMALDIIENTNETFFFAGKAGTGKSTAIKYIKEKDQKNTVVLAPTGKSAINVNGQTIHSFFQLPNRPMIIEDT